MNFRSSWTRLLNMILLQTERVIHDDFLTGLLLLEIQYSWRILPKNTLKHKICGPLQFLSFFFFFFFLLSSFGWWTWRCRSGKTIFSVTRYFWMPIKGLTYAGDWCHQQFTSLTSLRNHSRIGTGWDYIYRTYFSMELRRVFVRSTIYHRPKSG